MPFIAAIAPNLVGESEVQIRVRREKTGLSITVIPHIKCEPNTNDETVASLQAILARPFHLLVPEGQDPDAALAAALAEIGPMQAEVRDELKAYREAAEEARKAASSATTKKRQQAAKKGGAKAPEPAKPVEPEKPPVMDLFSAPPAAPATPPANPEPAAATAAPEPATPEAAPEGMTQTVTTEKPTRV